MMESPNEGCFKFMDIVKRDRKIKEIKKKVRRGAFCTPMNQAKIRAKGMK